jgi:peptide/nickel transport system substrate-binding protein
MMPTQSHSKVLTAGQVRRLLAGTFAVGLAATTLVACGSSPSPSAKAPSSKAGSTSTSSAVLTVAGDNGGPFPASENPYAPSNGLGQLVPFIYEPLFQFDWLKPTETIPWLATKYAWSNGGKTLTLTIRSGVKFSNGTPMTASDVAFTFEMLKKNPAMNLSGLQIDSVSQSGDTVTLTFPTAYYQQFYYVASTYIVPKSIWSKYKNPATAENTDPIGTGPYVVSSFSPSGIVLTANPTYWGGEPKIKKIVEPNILSNATCDSYLDSGKAQWGGCFLASLKQFKADKYNVFSSSPEQIQNIMPNLTKFPMSSLPFRKAISLSLNREADAVSGDLGEEPWITSPTGLVLPAEKSYLAPQYANLQFHENPKEAKAILKQAGFKWSSSGVLESPTGQPVHLDISVVAAYSDNVTSAETILQELKSAIGLQGSTTLLSPTAFTSAQETGNFQSMIAGSPGGLSPYVVYNGLLNDKLTAAVGKTASGDFERFYSPAAQSYLAEWAATDSLTTEKKAAAGLEGIMINDLPVIPYMYTVAWGEYNTKSITGWPSSSNPYAIATSYYTPENELVVIHLRPAS